MFRNWLPNRLLKATSSSSRSSHDEVSVELAVNARWWYSTLVGLRLAYFTVRVRVIFWLLRGRGRSRGRGRGRGRGRSRGRGRGRY